MTDILVNLGTCFWGWISVMNVKSLRISAVRGHCITPTLLAQGPQGPQDLASAYVPGHPDHHTEFPLAPRTHRTLSRQPPDSRPPWNHAHPARPLCPFFRKPFPLWYSPFKTQCVIVSESCSPGGELQGGSSGIMFLSSLTHPVIPQIYIFFSYRKYLSSTFHSWILTWEAAWSKTSHFPALRESTYYTRQQAMNINKYIPSVRWCKEQW